MKESPSGPQALSLTDYDDQRNFPDKYHLFMPQEPEESDDEVTNVAVVLWVTHSTVLRLVRKRHVFPCTGCGMRFCGQCQRTQNKRIGRDCMCDVQPAPDSTDLSARTVPTVPSGTKRRRLQKRVDELQTKPMRRHRVLEIFACAMAFAAVAPSCG